jgi:hypothetical protein
MQLGLVVLVECRNGFANNGNNQTDDKEKMTNNAARRSQAHVKTTMTSRAMSAQLSSVMTLKEREKGCVH